MSSSLTIFRGDAGTIVDSYISGTVVQYKEQIATLEKREKRYKTVFADKISVFRRACCPFFVTRRINASQYKEQMKSLQERKEGFNKTTASFTGVMLLQRL